MSHLAAAAPTARSTQAARPGESRAIGNGAGNGVGSGAVLGEAARVYEFSATLRTPLASISGYAELLLAGELGALNAEQHAALEVIIRNAERLEALLSALVEARRP